MEILIVLFTTFWAVEFYFFGWQRAVLIIARKQLIEINDARYIYLPAWYNIMSWIIPIVKYIIVLIIIILNWKVGIIILIGGFLLSLVLPIPYKLFYKNLFYKRAKMIMDEDIVVGYQYKIALDNYFLNN
jgi:hypothetical protein